MKDSTQLWLPKDQPVEFRVNTDDVLHDFWVPAFRLKTDAVPGLTTRIRVTPGPARPLQRRLRRALRPRPLHHARRGARGSQAEFTSWVGKQREGGLVNGVGYLLSRRETRT